MATIDQPKTAVLEISRFFDAPPERVFDAWVGDEWGRWLPPLQATCRVVTGKPAPGAPYRVLMAMKDGREVEITGEYLEVARPSKLVLTWVGNYHDGQATTITVLFAGQGKGTMMTLRQEGFHHADMRDNYHTGWTGPGGSFDKLAALLAP